MHEALNQNVFLVKEHVGMFKAANNYDIHDPQTGDLVMECREESLGFLTKFTTCKYLNLHQTLWTSPPCVRTVRTGIKDSCDAHGSMW